MKFYYRLICIVFSLLFLPISCAETSEDATAVINDVQETKSRYGSSLATLPKISEAAKIETATWSVFDDFELNATTMRNHTAATIKAKSSQMAQQTDSLLKKIPQALDTRPIYARVILANTRAMLLNQISAYDRIDSLQLENNLEEMNLAAANLFIEINRTFTKNMIDDEMKESEKKELEKQKRYLDSVYKSEIQDNNEK